MNARTRKLFAACYRKAMRFSDDPVTKNGSVIVVPNAKQKLPPKTSTGPHRFRRRSLSVFGVNRLPPGFAVTPERLARPDKYENIVHAEEDAIFRCARHGYSVEGLTMHCPWACCKRCARAISTAGIRRVVTHLEIHELMMEVHPSWHETMAEGVAMLKECGVEYEMESGRIGDIDHMFNGEIWQP